MTDRESTLPLMGEATCLIETDGDLAKVCARWRKAKRLGLDTEFERSRTFYPRPGLVQVCDGRSTALIDPEGVHDYTPFVDILRNERILKVLHSCSEDIEVLHRLSGTVPKAIFDTQVAAAFAGYGYSTGYRRLVKMLLYIDLPKDETRSDWLKRPLTPAQKTYAIMDVVYLLPVHTLLSEAVSRTRRESWLREDLKKLQDPERLTPSPETAYLRIRQAWRLDRRRLGVLRQLCAWREREARQRDIPRNFIVQDSVLVEAAQRMPSDIHKLRRINGLHPREARRSGRTMIKLIKEVLELPANRLPEPIPTPPDLRRFARTITRLKRIVQKRAEELAVPPELLAQNRVIEALVAHVTLDGAQSLPVELDGWRRSVIGTDLLAVLDEIN